MLRLKELHVRIFIWLLLLFGNLWISYLMKISAQLQSFAGELFLQGNILLMKITNWQLDSILVFAVSQTFWPLLIPYIINKILSVWHKKPLPKLELIIFCIWIILTLAFIIVQQGPI